MTHVASCGHVLGDNEGEDGLGTQLVTKSHSNDWSPALLYGTYCNACVHALKAEDQVLETTEKEFSWLNETRS